MKYANATPCECPRCRREFPFHWEWEADNMACMRGEDGEAVTEAPATNARRVAYERHVTCPLCGTQLRVFHELSPELYATVKRAGYEIEEDER